MNKQLLEQLLQKVELASGGPWRYGHDLYFPNQFLNEKAIKVPCISDQYGRVLFRSNFINKENNTEFVSTFNPSLMKLILKELLK